MAEEDAKLTKPPSSFMPELQNEPLAEVSYRFVFPGKGDFQCAYTGLVFVMAQKAEMCYRTVMWNESLLQPAGKVAAGPLFKIVCPEDAVCQLHLQHCEIKDAAFTETLLSVANMTDEGMAILKPLKITDTHAIVEVPQPSAFGIVRNFEVLWRLFRTPKPVRGQVLLFLQPANPVTQRQNLNLVLLSSNVPLEEVRIRHAISRYISAPINCRLIEEQNYTVHCPTAYKIQPKKAAFDLEFGPNYHPTFEVRLETSQEQVTITLRDQTDTDVWEQDIDLTDFRKSSASGQKLSK
ncbi:uncharacterized protein LOC115056478 isoform X2 [Echeneis naucrates]|nr:uncharacterized protein LOC115056478 isoform X2 [Echeneis naucrates]XP_029378800.1 uncharacterized protein LOC115056478 isoform X2 [Echeneis naucrates]XP_029378802.1 uncharacterized protein LOC115056478 isoform X2 [Echeneis naucrates]XP_029378803.1 uncharacterized protein LOC115056478 isoform X2 [Echeneis naucrates]